MSKEKRFEKIYSQGAGSIEIWVDKETGVNYLYHAFLNKSRCRPCVFNEILLCRMKSKRVWMKSSAYGFR